MYLGLCVSGMFCSLGHFLYSGCYVCTFCSWDVLSWDVLKLYRRCTQGKSNLFPIHDKIFTAIQDTVQYSEYTDFGDSVIYSTCIYSGIMSKSTVVNYSAVEAWQYLMFFLLVL
jgi:hypothetical protein